MTTSFAVNWAAWRHFRLLPAGRFKGTTQACWQGRTGVSAEIRRATRERASYCCEYCLRSQDDIRLPYHIEHSLPEKHGDLTIVDNLVLSCPDCNAYKGPDTGLCDHRQFAPLYSP